MTKEEKIKEAWGDSYPPSGTDANGWSNDSVNYGTFDVKEYDYIGFKNDAVIRPKSLQGIENNNGWIKIESEDDLPEKGEYYWTTTDKNKTPLERWFNKNWMINDGDGKITHYQHIIKPQPPIY